MALKPILSSDEFETRKRILSASREHNAECFSLIRVADVFKDITNSGLDRETVSFSLKSHLDFLICDNDSTPLFAVEYDGAHHSHPEQMRRDLLKDNICRHFGFPIVRINSRHLYKWEEDVIKWLLDYWFYSRMLYQAQEEGTFPADELPDPMWIGSADPSEPIFPMMLGLKYRASIQRSHQKGTLLNGIPFDWIGEDKSRDGYYSGISVLKIKDGAWVVGSIQMLVFNFGTFPSDIISELTTMELYRMLKIHFSTQEETAVSSEIAGHLLEQVTKGFHMCQSGGGQDNLIGLTLPEDISKMTSRWPSTKSQS